MLSHNVFSINADLNRYPRTIQCFEIHFNFPPRLGDLTYIASYYSVLPVLDLLGPISDS